MTHSRFPLPLDDPAPRVRVDLATPRRYRFGWTTVRLASLGLLALLVFLAVEAVYPEERAEADDGQEVIPGAVDEGPPEDTSEPARRRDAPAEAEARAAEAVGRLLFEAAPPQEKADDTAAATEPPPDRTTPPPEAPRSQEPAMDGRAAVAEAPTSPATTPAATPATEPAVTTAPSDAEADASDHTQPSAAEAIPPASGQPIAAVGLTGISDDGAALASFTVAGMDDPATLERWLARGVIALTLETPFNGAFVAAVDNVTGPGSPYGALRFARPDAWAASPGGDPRSNLRIHHAGGTPLDLERLEPAFAIATGLRHIADARIHFANPVAARILAAQTDLLDRLGPDTNPADLHLTFCIHNTKPTIQTAKRKSSGEIVAADAGCRR